MKLSAMISSLHMMNIPKSRRLELREFFLLFLIYIYVNVFYHRSNAPTK